LHKKKENLEDLKAVIGTRMLMDRHGYSPHPKKEEKKHDL
jgi:hypothetical protein